MNSISVTLGGKEYKIDQLPIRKSRAWREEFKTPISQILTGVEAAPGVLESKDVKGMVALMVVAKDVLLNSLDTVLDMLCKYAPAVATDRERIENEAFDDEVIQAFVKILELVFPFGEVGKALKMIGQPAQPTSKN